jgi:hypothetical protein
LATELRERDAQHRENRAELRESARFHSAAE